jgi:hypothetical protein
MPPESYRSLIIATGLDQRLLSQLSFDASPTQFVPMLINALLAYGSQVDGRHPLVAMLEEAHNRVGADRQTVCRILIQEAESYCR